MSPVRLPAVAEGGRLIVLVLATTAVILCFVLLPLGALAAALTLAALWLFRDPPRTCPSDENCAYAAADGTVIQIGTTPDRFDKEPAAVSVGVYLSVLSVHVIRAPLAGRVTGVEHIRGAYWPAHHPKARTRNRRAVVDIETQRGEIRLTLTAGVLARRIHVYTEAGAEVAQGQRLALIRFGSRTDVTFQFPVRLLVEVASRTKAGLSPIAQLNQKL